MHEFAQFRNEIKHADAMALGCSHTWGVGVEANETWSYLLGAMNFGVPRASSDQVVRIARRLIPEYHPSIVYCLWPDWSRFEYEKDGSYVQSLPSDPDRLYFMSTHDDAWCRKIFAERRHDLQTICDQSDCCLIDMTLYDLIPYIDHADRWPVSKLGHHYAPQWHQWVAKIFADAKDTDRRFPGSYE